MSESQNNQTNECKCIGNKEFRELKKQIAELSGKVEQLERQILTLRKALTK